MKKYFDKNLKGCDKKLTSNKAKHIDIKKKLTDLSKIVSEMSI